MRKLFLAIILLISLGISAQDVYVAKYYGNRQAAISYTFDDGLLEHFTMVFPKFQELGMKGTFGIIGSRVGKDHKGTPCMTWEQIKAMSDAGHEITNHGWRHQSIEKLSGEALRYEVQHNDTFIYNKVGVFPRSYFYPGNRKTEEGLALCSKDRVGTRTFQVSLGSKRDSVWIEKWVKRLLERREWGVTMTHGITTGYDAFPNPQILWNHLERMSQLRDRIWVATFHDVVSYITERDSVQINVQPKKDGYSVHLSLPLDKIIYYHPLTLVTKGSVRKAKQDGKNLALVREGDLTLFDIDPYGGAVHVVLAQ